MAAWQTCYPGSVGINFVMGGSKARLGHGGPLAVAMQQIADWLKKLGMSEYAERFAEERIEIDVLPELTDQDL